MRVLRLRTAQAVVVGGRYVTLLPPVPEIDI